MDDEAEEEADFSDAATEEDEPVDSLIFGLRGPLSCCTAGKKVKLLIGSCEGEGDFVTQAAAAATARATLPRAALAFDSIGEGKKSMDKRTRDEGINEVS